ncbi:MAG: MFS transporter [Ignavibacteriales bacterium]|nr:MFS transporter [Ignavibacteriales bacterium]
MPKVILQIAYEIDPEKREEYLRLADELKQHFAETQKKNYNIFEQKGKKNSFVEQFVCDSVEEYEALEDDLDEKADDLVNTLETMLKGGKAKYTTLVEA